jgi:hypothetical protein
MGDAATEVRLKADTTTEIRLRPGITCDVIG